jgi:hypothetical protein
MVDETISRLRKAWRDFSPAIFMRWPLIGKNADTQAIALSE